VGGSRGLDCDPFYKMSFNAYEAEYMLPAPESRHYFYFKGARDSDLVLPPVVRRAMQQSILQSVIDT
jgi:hypothetical protein